MAIKVEVYKNDLLLGCPVFSANAVKIGRASICELQIIDGAIAKYHALIEVHNSKRLTICGLEILRGKDGTIGRGRKVEDTDIGDGYELRLGDIDFRISVVETEDTVSATRIVTP